MNTYRLPRNIGEAWIKALRSGKYGQTDHMLCEVFEKTGCYCGIGLLGHLIGIPDNYMYCEDYISKEMSDKVPDELDGQTPLANELSNLNDNEGYSFNQIADWIETNVTLY